MDKIDERSFCTLFVLLFPACALTANAQPLGTDVRADFPHRIRIVVSPERTTMSTNYPLRVAVALSNLGHVPFPMQARLDGVPYTLAFDVASAGGDFERVSTLLSRSGPAQRELELDPGETAAGELLLLLGYDQGFIFQHPGKYEIRVGWQPGADFNRIYSQTIDIEVLPAAKVDEELLSELQGIATEYFVGALPPGFDADSPEAKFALERDTCNLLARIFRSKTPVFVDSDAVSGNAEDARLVTKLMSLVERYPESFYSPYIARFLGLVHLKTVEHDVSRQAQESGGNPTELARAHRAYDKARHYLERSSREVLWPRTTALENLGMLYALGGEWARVEECAEKLRETAAGLGGKTAANRLKEVAAKYRAKIRAVDEK